jgi:glycosyltransferase involved in cell wall biosynthesis
LRSQIESGVARLGLQDSVTLHGSDLDVAGFLSTLGIFVLSSVTEGLPVVILEAMAAGLPIVSTRVGGVPEAAPEGEVATYCPPQNPALLAQAMYDTATSSTLAARGEAARRVARERFGIVSMWQSYCRLFQELLELRSAGRDNFSGNT